MVYQNFYENFDLKITYIFVKLIWRCSASSWITISSALVMFQNSFTGLGWFGAVVCKGPRLVEVAAKISGHSTCNSTKPTHTCETILTYYQGRRYSLVLQLEALHLQNNFSNIYVFRVEILIKKLKYHLICVGSKLIRCFRLACPWT